MNQTYILIGVSVLVLFLLLLVFYNSESCSSCERFNVWGPNCKLHMNANCPQGTYYDLKTNTCIPFCRGCKTGVCENAECYSTPYDEKNAEGIDYRQLYQYGPGVNNITMANVNHNSTDPNSNSSYPVSAPLLRGNGSCSDWMLI